MIEALWSVEFESAAGSAGAGVIVIETGRVLGGDSSFMYVGNVKVEQRIVHADIKITRYSDRVGLKNIFHPLNEFHLKLTGPVDAQRIEFRGFVVENPSLQIMATAVRRAELP